MTSPGDERGAFRDKKILVQLQTVEFISKGCSVETCPVEGSALG